MSKRLCENCRTITIEKLLDGFQLGTLADLGNKAPNCEVCFSILSACQHQFAPELGSREHSIQLKETKQSDNAISCIVKSSNGTNDVVGKFRLWAHEGMGYNDSEKFAC
jgi:hypothetical protein